MTAGRPPRVLIDATSVPADRGGVGRYVDGLLGALGKVCGSAVDLVVVSLRTDLERYRRKLPGAEIIPAPAAVAHRPARLAWEQTGLPCSPSRSARRCCTRPSTPARCGPAVRSP